MFGKTTEFCHVCNYPITLKKNQSLPPFCSVCGADLANRAAETLVNTIECEHIKGAFGAGQGLLYATNKRLFFIKGRKRTDVDPDGGYAAAANNTIDALVSIGAEKISVNVPLENIGRIEDCKKLLRKGVTLHTKSGQSYNFFLLAIGEDNRGTVQDLKDFFAPYVNG